MLRNNIFWYKDGTGVKTLLQDMLDNEKSSVTSWRFYFIMKITNISKYTKKKSILCKKKKMETSLKTGD